MTLKTYAFDNAWTGTTITGTGNKLQLTGLSGARGDTANGVTRSWFSILNKTAGSGVQTAEVYLFDEIGGFGVSARDFVDALHGLPDGVVRIDVHLNSPGGDVFDGIAIKNALADHPAPVRVIVDGLAASSASFIAMAGDEVVMSPHSELMIHDAMAVAIGNAAEMKRTADLLDRASDNIASIYAERAGDDVAFWRKAMRDETWYSADEAVTAGLADRVGSDDPAKAETAKARFDLSIFNHAGRAHAPAPPLTAHRPPAEPETPNPNQEGTGPMSDTLTSGLRERLGIPADADPSDDDLLAAVDEALAERAETTTDRAPQLPAGVVTVDQTTLDDLRNMAQLGVAAREAQLVAERTSIVDAAVRDGRIAPARREHWLKALAADPGAAASLNDLAPGTIPVVELGTAQHDAEASEGDRLFARLYGTEA